MVSCPDDVDDDRKSPAAHPGNVTLGGPGGMEVPVMDSDREVVSCPKVYLAEA
jgi:hypothetical protein